MNSGIWLVTLQIAALAFVISVMTAVLISVLRIFLQKVLRKEE